MTERVSIKIKIPHDPILEYDMPEAVMAIIGLLVTTIAESKEDKVSLTFTDKNGKTVASDIYGIVSAGAAEQVLGFAKKITGEGVLTAIVE